MHLPFPYRSATGARVPANRGVTKPQLWTSLTDTFLKAGSPSLAYGNYPFQHADQTKEESLSINDIFEFTTVHGSPYQVRIVGLDEGSALAFEEIWLAPRNKPELAKNPNHGLGAPITMEFRIGEEPKGVYLDVRRSERAYAVATSLISFIHAAALTRKHLFGPGISRDILNDALGPNSCDGGAFAGWNSLPVDRKAAVYTTDKHGGPQLVMKHR